MAEWIGKRKKWLNGYTPPKPKPQAKENNDYGVVYYPIKCPKCGSKKNKCYASKPPVRYHVCLEETCKYHFKSVEAI